MSTEQEYDAQTDMVDDQDPSESGPGPYPEPFPTAQHQINHQRALNQQQLGQQTQGLQMGSSAAQGYSSMTQLLDPYDREHNPLCQILSNIILSVHHSFPVYTISNPLAFP